MSERYQVVLAVEDADNVARTSDVGVEGVLLNVLAAGSGSPCDLSHRQPFWAWTVSIAASFSERTEELSASLTG